MDHTEQNYRSVSHKEAWSENSLLGLLGRASRRRFVKANGVPGMNPDTQPRKGPHAPHNASIPFICKMEGGKKYPRLHVGGFWLTPFTNVHDQVCDFHLGRYHLQVRDSISGGARPVCMRCHTWVTKCIFPMVEGPNLIPYSRRMDVVVFCRDFGSSGVILSIEMFVMVFTGANKTQ